MFFLVVILFEGSTVKTRSLKSTFTPFNFEKAKNSIEHKEFQNQK